MKRFILLLASFIFLFLSYSQQRAQPVIVQGQILSAETARPLINAHVYIVHGEEEALTDSKGYFRIESWEKLPLRLTVEYKDHQPVSIVISDVSRKQTIRLKHR